MIGETDFIKRYLAPLTTNVEGAFDLKDDAAIFQPSPSTDLVISKDLILEDVHFLPQNTPEDIAHKALHVNFSDLAAKGAVPKGFLLGISFPRAPTPRWAERFANRLQQIIKTYNCPLLGGDTTASKAGILISVTMIGEVEQGNMVRRSGGKPGNLLFLSGTIGDAALGLELMKNPKQAQSWQLNTKEVDYLTDRYCRPQARVELCPLIKEFATAAMDVSDGLYYDLIKLCEASNLSAEIILDAIPFSSAFKTAQSTIHSQRDLALSWGDDYEILASIPPEKAETFLKAAHQQGISLTQIGRLISGNCPPRYIGSNQEIISIEPQGFLHF